MPDINSLRAQARRAHVNATKKVSRLKQQGAAISGTELDPRKPLNNVGKMNSRQLTSYVNKLQKFNARTTGYVGSADGLLARSQWREYKRLEARNNAAAERWNAATAMLQLPGQNMTIGQRRATMPADRVSAFGTTTNKPFDITNRKSQVIKGPKALQKLIDQMRGKLTPDYVAKHVTEQRKQYERMLEIIGDDKLTQMSKDMTDGQFAIAWNEGKLADATVTRYAVAGIEIGRANGTIDDDSNDDAYNIVKWARTLNT